MNKAEFVEQVASRTEMTKQQIEKLIDTAFIVIQETVSKGEEVKFVGFGTFDRAHRKSRNARNPQTGKTVKLPEMNVPRFRPGKGFKEVVKS